MNIFKKSIVQFLNFSLNSVSIRMSESIPAIRKRLIVLALLKPPVCNDHMSHVLAQEP